MARTHGKQFAKRAAAQGVELVAPDGGWGWCIVLAFGINHIFVIAVIQNFALIFAEKFKGYGVTITDLSLILNINSAVCNGLGLLNGPLLKKFSCRQVGLFGALLIFAGTFLTSYAVTMRYFVISFGVIFGLGFALMSPSNTFAINSYFKARRARAMGLAVTISGLGTVLMPLTVSFLLQHYTADQAMMIIAALTLNCIPASLLLQPVRWHMRPAAVASTEQTLLAEAKRPPRKRTTTVTSVDVGHSLFTVADDHHHHHRELARSVSQQQNSQSITAESQLGSLVTINLGPPAPDSDDEQTGIPPPPVLKKPEPPPVVEKKSFFKRMVELFDLDLLCQPSYTITAVGIAVAFCAEINFLLLTPVIFRELHGYDTFQIARYQSILAAVDLVFRLMAPYLGEWIKWSHKSMYLISIVILSLCRTLIMIFLDYEYAVIIGMFLGMAKGVRTVFMPLILPSLVPLHRLPSAIGLLMVMKGISFMTFGPLFGKIKDVTGSFVYVVIAINILTMITAGVWLTKDLMTKCRPSKPETNNDKS